MKNLNVIAFILLLIGGINWGLMGAFNYNMLASVIGDGTVLHVIYGLVGVCALYEGFQFLKTHSTTPAQ
jgi:uncharacterized membrane protein YuzA (DUF378 family)